MQNFRHNGTSQSRSVKYRKKGKNAVSERQKVFLSFSGSLSENAATTFWDFSRKVLLQEPYLSTKNALLGVMWQPEIEDKLRRAEYGIFFITKENVKNANWMFYEAGMLVGQKRNRKRVVPILVDIPTEELPSCFNGFHCIRFNERECRALVQQLYKDCGDPLSPLIDVVDSRFKLEWPILNKKWQEIVTANQQIIAAQVAKLRAEMEELNRLKEKIRTLEEEKVQWQSRVSFDENAFYLWNYALHNVIHIAREVCVLMMGDHPRNDDLPDPVAPGLTPPPHPGMEKLRIPIHIQNILHHIRYVYEAIPETSDCDIRVCLRDLRKDDHFHTFARSVPQRCINPNCDSKSVPISRECNAFKQLEAVWSQANCVIETTPEEGWGHVAKHHNDVFYETKSVLIASVIAKNVQDDKVSNAYTMWALFVSANKKGVFKRYHHAILQSFNDILSCMLNIMLRRNNCPNRTGI